MTTELAAQSGILKPLPQHARFLNFSLHTPDQARAVLTQLAQQCDGEQCVVGLGAALLRQLGASVPGLHEFSGIAGSLVHFPHSHVELWCWLRGAEQGELFHRSQALIALLQPAFALHSVVEGYKYREGRDLTGYVDGTENPQDQAAVEAAIVQGQGAGLDGGSYVAVQQWLHHFDRFRAFSSTEQDNIIGRRLSDNEELEDAPPTAHVKRTAQEEFDPPAFVLRRSMPWSEATRAGFEFVAFGRSLQAFEAQLRRMSGAEDGQVDGLFKFSEVLSTHYFWCPPMHGAQLDLRILN
jgi:putative iron-dependent peroxidase